MMHFTILQTGISWELSFWYLLSYSRWFHDKRCVCAGQLLACCANAHTSCSTTCECDVIALLHLFAAQHWRAEAWWRRTPNVMELKRMCYRERVYRTHLDLSKAACPQLLPLALTIQTPEAVVQTWPYWIINEVRRLIGRRGKKSCYGVTSQCQHALLRLELILKSKLLLLGGGTSQPFHWSRGKWVSGSGSKKEWLREQGW